MNIDKKRFFDCFRTYHKSARGKNLTQGQVDGLNFLLDQIKEDAMWDDDVPPIAYFLATVAHETAWTFKPIKELRGKTLTAAQKKYWPSGFYGRGYVQITWERNYVLAGNKLGWQLTVNPDLALRPDIAYEIAARGMQLGWFTGKKLSNYINSRGTDYHNARRIVNGVDKAAHIAIIAANFQKCLTVADAGESKNVSATERAAEGLSPALDSSSPKTEAPTIETAPVLVPQAEPPPTQPPVVTGVGTQWAALYTAISAPLAAFGAWVAGARTEIVYGVAIVTAVIGTTYMILRYKKRKDADDRLSAEKMEREKMAHEITMLQMKSAMSKTDNTVVVSPRPLESSDSQ